MTLQNVCESDELGIHSIHSLIYRPKTQYYNNNKNNKKLHSSVLSTYGTRVASLFIKETGFRKLEEKQNDYYMR